MCLSSLSMIIILYSLLKVNKKESGNMVTDIMDNQQIFDNCTEILNQIINDSSVPRNIRKAAEDSVELLAEDEEPTIKASTVISILDDISNDPNIPIHARILIWNILSELESVKD